MRRKGKSRKGNGRTEWCVSGKDKRERKRKGGEMRKEERKRIGLSMARSK